MHGESSRRHMTIFIAAPWDDKKIAKEAAEKFRAAGIDVTSRWIDQPDTDDPDELHKDALRDIEDIVDSHMLVLINWQSRGHETSGKAVETGIAIALWKPVVVVGLRTNIYHWLNMPVVDTVEEAITEVQRWEPVRDLVRDEILSAIRK